MVRATELLGQRAVRLDAIDKVTGRARFASDLQLPGMLYGVVVRSDRPHARIHCIDTTAAASLPGVEAIVTAADAPGMYGEVIKDQRAFAVDLVRHIGEPIAAVAAVSEEVAREAAALIEVEYEDLPAVFDPLEAMRDDAPRIHEHWERYAAPDGLIRSGNVCATTVLETGDVESAFRGAVHVFEDEYVTHSVHQSPMETRTAIADVDSGGAVTIYASTQHPFGVRAQIHEALGIPLTSIRVVPSPLGGGFGSKLEAINELYAAVLARKARRPVKLVNSREEDLAFGNPRHPMYFRIRSALDADGTLVGREVRVIMDAGAYATGSPVLTSVAALLAPGPYRIPNVRVEVIAVYTNNIPFSAFRGPTGPQTVFAIESHTDAIARRLGIDPLEFRLKHVFRSGDRAHNGQELGQVSLTEAINRAAAAIGWGEAEPASEDGWLRGKGIACTWWTTTGGAAGCTVRMNEDGTVLVQTGASEIGTGAVMAGVAQIVAAELGIALDKVRIVWGDTDATPYDAGAQGSRTVVNMGNAARDAAGKVRQELLRRAAEFLEAPVDDLDVVDGKVFVRGVPDRAVSYAELMAGAMWSTGAVVASSTYLAPPTPYDPDRLRGGFYPTFNSPSFHCHAADVEVDPETGAVRVRKIVVVQDVGFAINPLYVEGQMQGGSAQALGYALTEELHFEDGRVMNPNLALYKLPTTLEVPDIEPIILEYPSAEGPYGAKGVGEPPVIVTAGAIANAVYDATGVQLRRTPLTPERIYRALRGMEDDA